MHEQMTKRVEQFVKTEFQKALLRLDVKGKVDTLWKEISEKYNEPWRAYHTLQHIAEVLSAGRALACHMNKLDEWPEIALASVYHDVIYDPKAPARQNELSSAELAKERLVALGVDPFKIHLVYQSVLATDHTRIAPAGGMLGDIVHDADLFSLSRRWSRFIKDGGKVRKEYAHLSDEEFEKGRIEFMQALLRHPSIYRTDYAQRHWGKKARDNLHKLVRRGF